MYIKLHRRNGSKLGKKNEDYSHAPKCEQKDQGPARPFVGLLIVKKEWCSQGKDHHVKNHVAGCKARVCRDEGPHVEGRKPISSCRHSQIPEGVHWNTGHPSQESICGRPQGNDDHRRDCSLAEGRVLIVDSEVLKQQCQFNKSSR